MLQSAKVLIVGGHSVGKTTLFSQIVRGQSFPRSSESFKQSSEFITLSNNTLHVEIHDCLVSSPNSLITQTWRNVNFIIYVFSYDNLKSLDELSVWFRHVRDLIYDGYVHQIIVGNKIDMRKTSEKGSFDRALDGVYKELELTEKDFFLVTATTGDGVEEIKIKIAERFQGLVTRGRRPDSLKIIPHQTTSGCMCIN